MNDNLILDNYLLILKSNVEVFVHGTLESSHSDVQSLLKSCLDNTIISQRSTYCLMLDNGMYSYTDVSLDEMNNLLNKVSV